MCSPLGHDYTSLFVKSGAMECQFLWHGAGIGDEEVARKYVNRRTADGCWSRFALYWGSSVQCTQIPHHHTHRHKHTCTQRWGARSWSTVMSRINMAVPFYYIHTFLLLHGYIEQHAHTHLYTMLGAHLCQLSHQDIAASSHMTSVAFHEQHTYMHKHTDA